MRDLIAVAVGLAFLAELAFMARFVRIPWWRTPEGRMTMANEGVIFSVLCLALIASFYPALPGRDTFRFFVWSAIAAVFSWKTWLFYRRQSEGRLFRRSKKRDNDEDQV